MISWYRRHLTCPMMRHVSLRHELAVIIVLKVIALMAIWYLFFSPAHRPSTDAAAHLLGNSEVVQPQSLSGVK